MTWCVENRRGVDYFTSSVLSDEGWLGHGVTLARQNGQPFNLSLKTGDEPERVINNRKRVAESFGVSLSNSVWADQVHGRHVAWVDIQSAGAGTEDTQSAVPETDGLATNEPNLLLVTQHADCVPILLTDPAKKVVAAVHAGWKGTAAAIVLEAVKVMGDCAGSRPSDCLAAIGPSAGGCCYEVGEELEKALEDVLQRTGMNFSKRINLGEINRRLLINAGLREDSVDLANLCTICGGEQFHSHRRLGKLAGRMGSFILRLR
jgi:YfiH family protein